MMDELIDKIARALFDEDPIPMQMFDADDLRALARAALEAIEQDGRWAVVPVEPTDEMLARAANSPQFQMAAKAFWQAMIAARPSLRERG